MDAKVSCSSPDQDYDPSPTLNRMSPIPSQIISVAYRALSLDITLDTGATVSYIRLAEAQQLALHFKPNGQLAILADKKTQMASLGEVDFIVFVDSIALRVRALVMKNLQAACFGGTTFHADNDVQARITTGNILLHNKFLIKQSNPLIDFKLFRPHLGCDAVFSTVKIHNQENCNFLSFTLFMSETWQQRGSNKPL